MKKTYQYLAASGLLCALMVLPAQAQVHLRSGYVVRTAGDTIKGWLDDRGAMLNARQCRFRPTPNAETVLYAPQQLLTYGYDKGRVYETKTVADADTVPHPVFLQCLVRGEASLYTARNPDDSSLFFLTMGSGAPVALVDRIALVKVDGVSYQRGNQQYKKTLSQSFQKCLPMQASLNRLRLSTNELTDAVRRYNTCVGSPMTIGGQTRLPNKFTLSVSAGAESSEFYLTGLQGGVYYDKTTELRISGKRKPVLGLGLQYEMPSASKSMALRLEALYESQRYDAQITTNYDGYNYEQEFRVATSYLRMPVLLRYTYPRGRFRPFVEGGLGLNFALSVNQEQRTRTTNFGSGTYSEWQPIASKSPLIYEQSVIGGFGLTLGQPAGRNLSLQVRGEFGPGYVETDAYADIHINRIFLLLTFDLTK